MGKRQVIICGDCGEKSRNSTTLVCGFCGQPFQGRVDAYVKQHTVPQHRLYSKGYTSIGCLPCTRATQPGENPRAGRWWWEQDLQKECGLHVAEKAR